MSEPTLPPLPTIPLENVVAPVESDSTPAIPEPTTQPKKPSPTLLVIALIFAAVVIGSIATYAAVRSQGESSTSAGPITDLPENPFANTQNPFSETPANPFESTNNSLNPFAPATASANEYQNPFEKLQ